MNGINGMSSRRIGGLVSGLNTDELVEGMMLRSKTRLNQKNHARQQLKWKQDSYRNIIRSTNSFANKWMNKTDSSKNIGSDSFWKLNSASTSSNNFDVVAKNGAMNGNITVDYVAQLATSESLTSKKFGNTYFAVKDNSSTATADEKIKLMDQIALEVDRMAKMGNKLSVTVEVDGIKRNIDLGVDKAYLDKLKSPDGKFTEQSYSDFRKQINTRLEEGIKSNFGNKVRVEKGSGNEDLKISSDSKLRISGNATFYFGIESGTTNKPDIYNSIKRTKGQFGNIAGAEYEFKINGKEFKFTENDSINKIMETVNSSDCGVKMTFSEYSNTFKLTAVQEGSIKSIDIEQTSGNLLTELFGVASGSSISSKSVLGAVKADNKPDMAKLKENISAPFEITMTDSNGNKITKIIEIPSRDTRGNKLDYSKYTDDQFIGLLDTEINKAFDSKKFDVKLNTDGKIEISNRDGAQLEISGYKGDNKMLGILGFTGKTTNAVDLTTKLADIGFKENDTIKVNGGNEIKITADMTIDDLVKKSNGNISFESGMFKINNVDTLSVTGGAAEVFGIKGDYKSTKAEDVDFTEKLSVQYGQYGVQGDAKVNVGGVEVQINADMTFKQMIDTMNTEYEKTHTGAKAVDFDEYGNIKFNVNVKDVSGNFMQNIFKNGNIQENATGVVNTRNSQGKDAIFSINGEFIQKSGNTIEYDGVEITFKNTFDGTLKGGTGEKITVSSDVDDAVKQIKEFMDDYNKLIDEIKGKLTEKQKYKEFSPLTDEQKKEMTKEQIEKWEQEAQTGLLANDPELTRYLQELRSVMYQKSPNGLALYDLGITTGDFRDGGKLKFADKVNGKSGEEHLREMLSTNPDKVKQMFTDPNNGLAARLEKANDAAMNTSVTKRGYIANIAGMEGTFSDTDSLISKKLIAMEQDIKNFEEAMKKEEEGYWNQFTALEKVIAKLNAQSEALFGQMMGQY